MRKYFKLRRARIATDNYSGFEVQVWRWWFHFWVQPRTNTHLYLEDAERYAKRWLRHIVKEIELD
jgi:hypothetical protein